MKVHPRMVSAWMFAAIGLLSMLGLSFVFPALGSPVALVIGAAAGVALALRDRLPLESTSFRLSLALLAVASAVLVWINLQPRYIGI